MKYKTDGFESSFDEIVEIYRLWWILMAIAACQAGDAESHVLIVAFITCKWD